MVRQGATAECVADLIQEVGARDVYWSRRYTPPEITADTALKSQLTAQGVRVHSFAGRYLLEPWVAKTKSDTPFKVFTPFWRACLGRIAAVGLGAPLPVPANVLFANLSGLSAPSAMLDDLDLLPKSPNWAASFPAFWTPGSQGAHARFEAFLGDGARGYADGRDRPATPHSSRLSPHLQVGSMSPREVWTAIDRAEGLGDVSTRDAEKFRAELGWREFSSYLLFHTPSLPEVEFQPKFRAFPWRDDPDQIHAWQRGQTGYPLVDADMRELWTTGGMHNRVRMVVASFLVKHLRVDWRVGRDWFWDTLVDADLASNTASWQWVAGCGADAAPYFRVFNPMTQARKFDPEGVYLRRWVPELAGLPGRYIAAPWEAPEHVRQAAGVTLGKTYPTPIVDHAPARIAVLEAFQSLAPLSE